MLRRQRTNNGLLPDRSSLIGPLLPLKESSSHSGRGQSSRPRSSAHASPATSPVRGPQSSDALFNILPVDPEQCQLPLYDEVEGARAKLRDMLEHLPPVPMPYEKPPEDLLEWLQQMFGFQAANVANQRENIILLLSGMEARRRRNNPPPRNVWNLSDRVVEDLLERLMENYRLWCNHLLKGETALHLTEESPLGIPRGCFVLLYIGLWLLIWGEAANLRFLPECLCYIFHHMAEDLKQELVDQPVPLDIETQAPLGSPSSLEGGGEGGAERSGGGVPGLASSPRVMSGRSNRPPSARHDGAWIDRKHYLGEGAFLENVIKPIYDIAKLEAENSKLGDHSKWRNYDDLNEFFWFQQCMDLGWPMKREHAYFKLLTPKSRTDARASDAGYGLGEELHIPKPKRMWGRRDKEPRPMKANWVEVRTFLQTFRSFERVWTFYILLFQALVILSSYPPISRVFTDIMVTMKMLSLFITYAVLQVTSVMLEIVLEIYPKLATENLFDLVLRLLGNLAWLVIMILCYDGVFEFTN